MRANHEGFAVSRCLLQSLRPPGPQFALNLAPAFSLAFAAGCNRTSAEAGQRF